MRVLVTFAVYNAVYIYIVSSVQSVMCLSCSRIIWRPLEHESNIERLQEALFPP